MKKVWLLVAVAAFVMYGFALADQQKKATPISSEVAYKTKVLENDAAIIKNLEKLVERQDETNRKLEDISATLKKAIR